MKHLVAVFTRERIQGVTLGLGLAVFINAVQSSSILGMLLGAGWLVLALLDYALEEKKKLG